MANDKNFSKKISPDSIVAYNISGEAITLKEYRQRNEKAIQSHKEGKYKTSQELKEEFKARG